MTNSSNEFRDQARRHNVLFDEAMADGDEIGAAWHASDAIKAEDQAEELFHIEHPEVRRLDEINAALATCAERLVTIVKLLTAIFVVLCVIAYRQH